MMKGPACFGLALLIAAVTSTAVTAQDCHPFPGAVAQDCLELVSKNLNNQDLIACDSSKRATIRLRDCVITTACTSNMEAIDADTAVRRALTTIGRCALSDYGSISGIYKADDGSVTCYLYPGREGYCSL